MSMRPVSLIVLLTLLVGTLAAVSVQSVPTVSFANDPAVPRTTPAQIEPTATIALAPIGTYTAGQVGAAEIVTYDPVGQVLYVINGATDEVDIVDISDPTAPTKTGALDLTTFGAAPTSADFYSYGTDPGQGLLAVSVENANTQAPGQVVFFDRDGNVVRYVRVGPLPDMVTFTPDGTNVLVANEGEPSEDYTVDPEGSISIINVSTPEELGQWNIFLPLVANDDAAAAVTTQTEPDTPDGSTRVTPLVKTATFTSFNDQADALRAAGVRIFGPGATLAEDLEPEYIAVAPDGQTAYVTLQENNAVAVVDIANATVTSIVPLGTKDYSLAANALDASDRDNTINITTWPVKGMYQPDAIATYQAGGMTYLVTANEGDARDYDGFSEEFRIEDLTLDTSVFTDAATLQAEENLGRLRVTNTLGDTDDDNEFEELYAYGARSFSIWDASGSLVYDSANEFEQITAAAYPDYFNANYDDDDNVFEFDARSDDKGPEPEGVTTGVVDGRTYAFIGLERIGGVMVYDVTDPNAPAFVQYINTANFTGSIVDGSAGDVSPEGLIFIPAGESPTGQPLLVVTHELSGTTTVFSITTSPGATTLTLLHNNDGETGLLPTTETVDQNGSDVEVEVGGIAAFKTVTDREIGEATNAGNSVVMVYAGDAFLASATLQCSFPIDSAEEIFDATGQRQLPYTAHILGNHEFDYAPDFLSRFIRGFDTGSGITQPFLSANLDFSSEPILNELVDPDGLIEGTPENNQVIGKSMIYTDPNTGATFGIVGATTPALASVSSPRNVQVVADTVRAVQAEIYRLQALGVNKIIFVSHLQDVQNDRQLIQQLQGLDVAVAGGGDDFLVSDDVNQDLQLLPGQEAADIEGTYPLTETDVLGNTVYIVTSIDKYRFLGRLDVQFDALGNVTGIDTSESYPRRVVIQSATTDSLGITDAVTPDAALVTSVNDPVTACLDTFSNTTIAYTEILFDVSRDGVRGGENNMGNLVADAFMDSYDRYRANTSLPEQSLTNPVVAIQNGGGIRQNAGDVLPRSGTVPGPITQLDTIDVLPFNNFISVVQEVSPTLLLETLDNISTSGIYHVANLKLTYTTTTVNGETRYLIDDITLVNTDSSEELLVENGAVVPGAPDVTVVTNSFVAEREFASAPNQSFLEDNSGFRILYEQPLREYLLTFPSDTVNGFTGPTIPSGDPRYQPGGEGRITIP
jgi:YVTN family beta-propeller protein